MPPGRLGFAGRSGELQRAAGREGLLSGWGDTRALPGRGSLHLFGGHWLGRRGRLALPGNGCGRFRGLAWTGGLPDGFSSFRWLCLLCFLRLALGLPFLGREQPSHGRFQSLDPCHQLVQFLRHELSPFV